MLDTRQYGRHLPDVSPTAWNGVKHGYVLRAIAAASCTPDLDRSAHLCCMNQGQARQLVGAKTLKQCDDSVSFESDL